MKINKTFENIKTVKMWEDEKSVYDEGGSDLPSSDNYENLEFLNHKINAVTKDLSYWDLYRIDFQVTDAAELDATYNNLAPGRALVIAANDSFTVDDITYYRGDVVVKMTDGSAAKINAISSGVYVPVITQDEDTKELTFTYDYTATSPAEGDEQVFGPFKIPTGTTVYAIFEDFSSPRTFSVKKYGDSIIYPIVKFFNELGEELVISYTLTQDENNLNWTLTATAPANTRIQIK